MHTSPLKRNTNEHSSQKHMLQFSVDRNARLCALSASDRMQRHARFRVMLQPLLHPFSQSACNFIFKLFSNCYLPHLAKKCPSVRLIGNSFFFRVCIFCKINLPTLTYSAHSLFCSLEQMTQSADCVETTCRKTKSHPPQKKNLAVCSAHNSMWRRGLTRCQQQVYIDRY